MQESARVIVKEIPKSNRLRRKYRWEVDARPLGGQRRRFSHGDKHKAESYCEKIHSVRAMLAQRDREDVTEEIIEQAVRAAKELRKWNADIGAATKFYVEHLKKLAKIKSVTVEDATKEYVEFKTKMKRSDRHLADITSRLAIFSKSLGKARVIHSLTEEELVQFIEMRGAPQTQKNYFTILHAFFNWSRTKGFIVSLPLSNLSKPIVDDADIETLSLQSVRELLERSPTKLLPSLVLQLFCGIRRSESYAICWDDVDLDQKEIFVSKKISKTDRDRYIKIPDNAIEWLRSYEKEEGLLVDYSSVHLAGKAYTELKASLSFDVPKNVLRKTFISSHLWSTENQGNYAVTASVAGNSEAIVRKSYAKCLRAKVADAHFLIRPSKTE